MINQLRSWCLVKSDRQVSFASDGTLDLFMNAGATGVRPCFPHPAVKVLLALHGQIEVFLPNGGSAHGAGVIIPPEFPRSSFSSAGHVTLFIEPWCSAPGTLAQLTFLDRPACRRLLDALQLDQTVDLQKGRQVLSLLLGAPGPLDPRVRHALNSLTKFERLDALAAEVGLSPPRLRALTQHAIGIPLVRLRLWARLRDAIAYLDRGMSAAAVQGGFADQPHFIHATRQLLGHTPGSLISTTATGHPKPGV